MIYSCISRVPRTIQHYRGQVAFLDEQEKISWCRNFVELVVQKLQDTHRWQKAKTLLQNIVYLTPAEREKLVSLLNLKTYFYRIDRWSGANKVKNKANLINQAKTLIVEYNRLLDEFFEGRIRPEHKKTIAEVLSE